MNVYDFDGTIYKGESGFDFFFYCLVRRPKLILFVHKVCINIVKYKLCMVSKEQFSNLIYSNIDGLIDACPDFKELAVKFWDKHMGKIKAFYINQQKEDDVIVSASFDFMLEPICERLGVKNVVCSVIDLEKRKVKQLCFRETKPVLFGKCFPDTVIDEFYTDSKNDIPMAKLSKKSFLVKGNKIKDFTV